MEKIDFKKNFKDLYKTTSKEPEVVDVPAMNFLMVDGKGDPNTSKEYSDAIEALYPVAYTLKFTFKKGPMAIDYGVMPLQGLWWADNMNDFVTGKMESWKWTLMIMQPDFITREMVDTAIHQVKEKKNPVSLPKLRYEEYREGKACQLLHIGPYSEEGPNIQKMHKHLSSLGGTLSGKHHEIYLSDARRTAPEKLKTILRQPFK